MKILDVGFVHDGQIAVGKVIKAHGIKGEIKVYSFSGRPDDFHDYPALTLVSPENVQSSTYAVEQARVMGDLVILRLAGFSGRNAAEGLRGWEVRIDREFLSGLGPNTYYWHDLVDLPVITGAGERLGVLMSLMNTAAHDILVITGGGREYLIPAVAECVAGLAPDGKALIVTPPPGLLEINADVVPVDAS